MRFSLSTLALFGSAVYAAPNALPAAECKLIKAAITALHATSTATAFCSSYLSISTSTCTATTDTTQTTSFGPPTTVTVATSTITATPVSYILTSTPLTTTYITVLGIDTNTYPDYNTVTATTTNHIPSQCTSTPILSLVARNAHGTPVAKPSCLSAYSSGAKLSSACSCLSIPTPRTTTTVTRTHHVSTLSTVQVTATVTVTDPESLSLISTVSTSTVTNTITIPNSEPVFIESTITVTPTSNGFYLQATGVTDPDYDGKYVAEDDGGDNLDLSANEADAILLFLDDNCMLVATDQMIPVYAFDSSTSNDAYLLFTTPNPGVGPQLVCSVEPGVSPLMCTDGAGGSKNVLNIITPDLDIGPAGQGSAVLLYPVGM